VILTQSFRALQPKSLLDDTNRESGRIYSKVMATHWRIFRKHGVWLSQFDAMKLDDYLLPETTLHAHSRDAAQEAFYKACKTIKALKKAGDTEACYPYKRKFYRTTIWKSTGVRIKDGVALLARARGLEPVKVVLPARFLNVTILEMRLVYNHKAKRYDWHVVADDKIERPEPLGDNVIAVDMGEIHPAAVCDREQALVVSARAMRSVIQGRNKALAEIATLQSRCKRGSRRYNKLQRAKNKIKDKAEGKTRDINHKVSRAVIDFAVERKAGTIVIGDVRDAADRVNIGHKNNQKVSQWAHGQLRRYISYKAAMVGMDTVLQNERYTTKTCPCCGKRNSCKGRVYRCTDCRWTGSRDGQVGAPNILSNYLYGELARVQVTNLKYRHPYLTGKRSRPDTAHVACVKQEAAGL
jgi:putative transposase